MVIFFDIGNKGAISYFKAGVFYQVKQFIICKKSKFTIREKIHNWHRILKELFPNPDLILQIGCYKPFGNNRKIIAHLAMLIAIIMLHFKNHDLYLISEWNAWKTMLQTNKIPKRKIKKLLTIEWVNKNFKFKNSINDDEADAILGGMYLTRFFTTQKHDQKFHHNLKQK